MNRAKMQKEYRIQNPERTRKWSREGHWKRRGLDFSSEKYDLMFEFQGGKCLVCGNNSEKRLHVDHDHSTGYVRGLLCGNCNLRLGWYEKNRDRVNGYLL